MRRPGLPPLPAPRDDREPARFDRALVVRFGRVGDTLVLTPFLRALARASRPSAVDVLTTPTGKRVLATSPHVRRRWSLRWRKPPGWTNPEKRILLRRLAGEGYDVVFLLERSPRYHRLADGLEDVETYALCAPDQPPTPRRARPDPREHAAAKFDRLLALAGVPHAGWGYTYPIPPAARDRALRLLEERGVDPAAPMVGIHPGSHHRSRRWRRKPGPKAWPPERFAEVADGLAARHDAVCLLTGTADEVDLTARVAGEAGRAELVDLAGASDLPTLAALQERCRLYVSGDTGPAHLAAAVGTPLVALFGPTPPWDMGPLGDEAKIRRLWPDPSPAPASARGEHHPRLWALEPADVLDAAAELIREPASAPAHSSKR